MPERPAATDWLLGIAAVLVVGSSHLSMLWLASLYTHMDRSESVVTPEAIVGALAMILVIMVTMGRKAQGAPALRLWATRWLLLFIVVAAVGEILRSDRQLGNVPTFLSIFGYYAIGVAIGRRFISPQGRLPIAGPLIAVYIVWYVGLLLFYVQGDLGFYGEIPGEEISRLEFASGYTATEIPIYVGFHFPVLLHVLTSPYGAMLKLLAGLLALCAIFLVYLSASVAAMIALGLIVMVFVFAHRGLSWSKVTLAGVLATSMVAIASLAGGNLLLSAQTKIEDFALGEGIRALIYAELIYDISEQPLGIGKGRFVHTNNFSWLGEGVYPHQNLLGIGAELGVVALALFVFFCLAVFVGLGRKAWSLSVIDSARVRQLLAIALAIFVFQQFRGLLHDTWVFKETYFWVGMAFGVVASGLSGARRDAAADARG